ncbi:MAG: choice-of-anchor E domain-containing protein [Phycisphaerae bacterium]|nr:choice-of-anchor E domain-containing protein [Phycisphaerae bacterium]
MNTAMLPRALALGAGLSAAVGAQAEVVTYTADFGPARTNWTEVMTLPKWDGSLGTLQGVTLTLGGSVAGSARFESTDAGPATIDMTLSAELAMKRPDNTSLVVALPLVNTTDNVTAFDGTIDFGGDSGRTHDNLSASDTQSLTVLPADADFALFLGAGNLSLDIKATGASVGSGSGNLIVQFLTDASAHAEIEYRYIPVPTPGAFGLAAAAGLFVSRRRR